jgi:hypothetical protein
MFSFTAHGSSSQLLSPALLQRIRAALSAFRFARRKKDEAPPPGWEHFFDVRHFATNIYFHY